jgi:hypothetical protein
MLTTENAEKKKSSPRRPRVRTLVKLALLAVFTAMLIPVLQILIPAFAYRADLIALLNYSDDCKAPCFMGIMPRIRQVMLIDDALEILRGHAWVSDLTRQPDGRYSWKWSGLQPAMMSDETYFPQVQITEFVYVRQTVIPTHATFAAVINALGMPDGIIRAGLVTYEKYGLVVELTVEMECSHNFVEILQSETVLYFGHPWYETGDEYTLTDLFKPTCR